MSEKGVTPRTAARLRRYCNRQRVSTFPPSEGSGGGRGSRCSKIIRCLKILASVELPPWPTDACVCRPAPTPPISYHSPVLDRETKEHYTTYTGRALRPVFYRADSAILEYALRDQGQTEKTPCKQNRRRARSVIQVYTIVPPLYRTSMRL